MSWSFEQEQWCELLNKLRPTDAKNLGCIVSSDSYICPSNNPPGQRQVNARQEVGRFMKWQEFQTEKRPNKFALKTGIE